MGELGHFKTLRASKNMSKSRKNYENYENYIKF